MARAIPFFFKSMLPLCFFILLIVANFFEEKLLRSTEALALLHYNHFYVVNQTAETLFFFEVTHAVFKPSRVNFKSVQNSDPKACLKIYHKGILICTGDFLHSVQSAVPVNLCSSIIFTISIAILIVFH